MSPINDPGNAATAPGHDRTVNGKSTRHRDRHQRALTAILGFTLGVAILVGGIGTLATGAWQWAAGSAIGWLSSVFISAAAIAALRGDK